MRKKIVAGNWKMNKTPKEAAEFCKLMKEKVVSDAVEVVFCVPFVDLYPVLEELKGTGIGVGAENMHFGKRRIYRRGFCTNAEGNGRWLCHSGTFRAQTVFR